jgi:hypothetical protein
MMKMSVLSVAAASLMAVAAIAAPTASGLKPGASVGAFDVVDVSGPSKGKQLCYRCQYGNSPVVAAFVNGDPMESAGLIAGLQKVVDAHKDKKLRSFVVYMGGQENKDAIEKVAASKKVTIPLTFLPGGPQAADIANYKISPDAKNTVLLWNRGQVQANFVNVDKASLASVDKAAAEMLAK